MAQTSESSVISQPAAVLPANHRLTLVLVVLAVTFYWASLYVYVPTLGVYAQNITGSLSVVGLILSMYGLWQAVVRLPLGIAADWYGRRKPFLFFGFALSALGAWLMATATGANQLIVGRSVTGLAAATWVPLVVIFSSLFPADQAVRATSLLSIVNSLSRVLATAVTGSLNDAYGIPFAFFVAMGIAGLAILVTLPVREVTRAPKRPSFLQIGVLITRRDVLVPALLSAVGQYISWATTFGFLPILAKNLGASSEMLSLLTSLFLFISMGGNLLTSWLANREVNIRINENKTLKLRFGNLSLVYISFVILILGTLGAALAPNLSMLIAAQVLIGFGSGICYPLLMGMSIEKVNEEERATAMGLHQAVYAIGMFAGPWVSGMLAQAYGIPPMFIITAGGCLFLSLVLSRLLRQ